MGRARILEKVEGDDRFNSSWPRQERKGPNSKPQSQSFKAP
jgi:hypothetical protein